MTELDPSRNIEDECRTGLLGIRLTKTITISRTKARLNATTRNRNDIPGV